MTRVSPRLLAFLLLCTKAASAQDDPEPEQASERATQETNEAQNDVRTSPPDLESPLPQENDNASENAGDQVQHHGVEHEIRTDGSDTQREARDLFAQGLGYVQAEDYAAALQAFKAAHALVPHHSVLFNIARVYEKLYEPEKAWEFYAEYLRQSGNSLPPEQRANVKKTMDRLEAAALAQKKRRANDVIPLRVSCPYPGFVVVAGEVTVATSPLDGELYVNRGTSELCFHRRGFREQKLSVSSLEGVLKCTPVLEENLAEFPTGAVILREGPENLQAWINGQSMPANEQLILPLGEHLLKLSAPNHQAKTVTIRVTPGVQRISAHLMSTLPTTKVIVDPGAMTPRQIAGITIGGVGAALGAAAIGIFLWNDQRHREWERDFQSLAASDEQTAVQAEQRAASNEELEAIQRIDTLNWVTGIAGGVLMATGAATYFWKSEDDNRRTEVGPLRARFTVAF